MRLLFIINFKRAGFSHRSAVIGHFLFPKCNRQSSIQSTHDFRHLSDWRVCLPDPTKLIPANVHADAISRSTDGLSSVNALPTHLEGYSTIRPGYPPPLPIAIIAGRGADVSLPGAALCLNRIDSNGCRYDPLLHLSCFHRTLFLAAIWQSP